MNIKTHFLVALAVMTLLVSGVQAAVISYSNQAAFEAAITGEVVHDFSGIAPAGSYVYLPNPLVRDGVSFAATGYAFVIDPTWSGLNGQASYGSAFFSGQSSGVNPVTIAASFTDFYAIGFTYGSYTDPSAPVTALLSSGDSFVFQMPAATGQTGFIGFVSEDALTSVTFFMDGAVFDVVNFITGTPAQQHNVPEPAALLLVGVSLIGLGFARRKAHRA